MSQHFLLSSAAKSLTLGQVARMSDEEAERVFIRLRWQDNGGAAYCPRCGATKVYQSRRAGCLRWQCKACNKDFSLTSGTLFASRKLPLRGYLMAIAVFCNEVKGKSMLALSRDVPGAPILHSPWYDDAFAICVMDTSRTDVPVDAVIRADGRRVNDS